MNGDFGGEGSGKGRRSDIYGWNGMRYMSGAVELGMGIGLRGWKHASRIDG